MGEEEENASESDYQSARDDDDDDAGDLKYSESEGEEEKNNKYSFFPMPERYLHVFSKVRHNHYKDVEEILDTADEDIVDAADENGNTILHVACQNGLKRMAKICLRRNCNVNVQNAHGQTPLHFCFAYGYNDLGEYLIAKGGADPSVKNDNGLTCYQGLVAPQKK